MTASRRADAQRNRELILTAARQALTEATAELSMAEVSRRAGVGMATLYRNFPSRRDLLEALYTTEVDELCEAADAAAAAGLAGDTSPAQALVGWLRRFTVFHRSKHPVAAELLRHTDAADPVFGSSRDRVLHAGRPLLVAAQQAREVRSGITIDQVLDLVLAASTVPGDAAYADPVLQIALDGLTAGVEPATSAG